MFRKGFRHVLMAEAGDGSGGGSAAAGDAGQAAGAGAGSGSDTAGGQGGSSPAGGQSGGAAGAGAGQGGDAGAAAGQGGSALQQGGQGQAPSIPEKYQVKKEDGSIDIEASSLKLAEAYTNLEKRIGTGDLPPKSAEEYQVAVPDALKDKWNPKEDPLLGEFLKDAHAAGMTQKQVDLALSRYMDIAPKLVAGASQLSAEECTTQLKSEWKTDDQYKAEVGNAYKAAVGYGGGDAEGIIKDYGNDPRIIRLLAKVGGEMGEDRSPSPPGGSLPGGQSVESLMASEAYTNPKHADHARVSKQIADHFARQAAAAEKAGATPIL